MRSTSRRALDADAEKACSTCIARVRSRLARYGTHNTAQESTAATTSHFILAAAPTLRPRKSVSPVTTRRGRACCPLKLQSMIQTHRYEQACPYRHKTHHKIVTKQLVQLSQISIKLPQNPQLQLQPHTARQQTVDSVVRLTASCHVSYTTGQLSH